MKKSFIITLIFVVFSGCATSLLVRETRVLMDTFSEITVYSSSKVKARDAIEDAFKEIERIEKVFSRFDMESELSKVNRIAGREEVKVSEELFKVIERSIYYSRLSKGSFDVTVAPLVDIWHDARENKLIPDEETINAELRHVGYRNIVMDKDKMSIYFLDEETEIDLGGIVKGYAVDRAKEVLISHGIEDALIDIGGNIYALGSVPHNKPWQIGIQHPRNKKGVIYSLDLKDRAISTSGDYERFFILEGKRFSHIIDPGSGRPIEGITSVTIVADSAEKADALSTAIFVMGVKKTSEFIKTVEGVEVFIFDKECNLVKYP